MFMPPPTTVTLLMFLHFLILPLAVVLLGFRQRARTFFVGEYTYRTH